jgi:hypothetical protein
VLVASRFGLHPPEQLVRAMLVLDAVALEPAKLVHAGGQPVA